MDAAYSSEISVFAKNNVRWKNSEDHLLRREEKRREEKRREEKRREEE
jgi:hypothetical protein